MMFRLFLYQALLIGFDRITFILRQRKLVNWLRVVRSANLERSYLRRI